jgi:4-carboxymuconolactone decarboxylase
MTTRPARPRLAPVTAPDLDADAHALLLGAGRGDGPPLNIFATLVRYPGLFRRWLPFAGKLLAGKLPARDRELAILRTAWRCGSEYEWGQHTLIASTAGLTDDEIARVQDAPEGWDERDAVVLRAVDELHADSCISDSTWTVLAGRYDERQLIELLMLIGHYHLLAFTLNSLGVERDEGVPGFER